MALVLKDRVKETSTTAGTGTLTLAGAVSGFQSFAAVGVGGYGGGSLIYLPELTQAELNSFCHVLFCAITNDTGYKNSAQTIYRSFKFRSQTVEDKFGEGTSDPSIFGQLLIDSGPISTEQSDQMFKNIRLLPSRAKFRLQIERWAASALEEISET